MAEKIPVPIRTDDDIRKVAESFLAGQVFTSTFITDRETLIRIFRPLEKLTMDELVDFMNSNVGFLFEYFDPKTNVDPETKWPVFNTLQVMSCGDAIKMASCVAEILRKKPMKVSFKIGQLVMTQGVAQAVNGNDDFARFSATCMKRHISGDWGELSDEDRDANNRALVEGNRLFSSYKLPSLMNGRDKIWIITEADRAVTTILFPDEY